MSLEYRLFAWPDGGNPRPATPDELRAAVLPLIDYEAVRQRIREIIKTGAAGALILGAESIVDAALGLKETPAVGQEGTP